MRIYPTHKKHPCKACRFIKKKCTWRDKSTRECDRCITREIECVPIQDTTELYLYMTEDGDKEVQELWDTIDELEYSMEQINLAKTALEQSLAKRPQPPLEWKLSITNGILQLDTPIKTMDELSMFTQASIRYLSPFIGLFKKKPVRFECNAITVSLGISTVLQRQESIKPRRRRFIHNSIDYVSDSESPSLNNRGVIDHLIALYFQHYLPYVGLLHRSTFLEHYYALDDPMDSALVLAVCIDALIVIRQRLIYTQEEVLTLLEAFYDRCRDLLFDWYDDPSRKLDTIVTTSLLQQYTADILLNCREANRLATIALLMCTDLVNDREKLTDVEWILLQRNYFHLQILNQFYNLTFENKVDLTTPLSLGPIGILDSEPETTQHCLYIVNEVLRLLCSTYISSIIGKVSNIFHYRYCDVFIEDIMQYEPIIKEWWASLPPELRLCDDPFDPNAYKLVEKIVPPGQLLPFTVLHLLTGVIASSILQPHIAQDSESTVTNDAIGLVRSKLLSLSLNSCKVLVYILGENWNPRNRGMPGYGLTLMRYTIYCLEKLSSCKDIPFPITLLGKLKKSLGILSKSLLPADHKMNSSSPLLDGWKNSKKSPLEIYEQYPFPGLALTSDILYTSFSKLEEQHFNFTS